MTRDRELQREIQIHLEMEAEEQMANGAAPDQARRAARRAFGSVAHTGEEVRAVWVPLWIDDFRRDVAYAARALARNPIFAVVIVATLALGLGANAGIYALIDQVLLRPLPVRAPEELVLFDGPGPYQGSTRGRDQVFSAPMFRGLRDAAGSVMNGVLARYNTGATLTLPAGSRRVFAEIVSGDYFSTLGVGAAAGRLLGPSDDTAPGANPVIVLSHGLWMREFGGAPAAIDSVVSINGTPLTIVGVTSPGFAGLDPANPADFFVPMSMKRAMTPTWDESNSWRTRWVSIVGRLRPGVSPEQAKAALDVAYRQLLQEDIKTGRISSESDRQRFLSKSLVLYPGNRGRTTLRQQFLSPLVSLMGMVGLVLLIACANVANLLLARAASQQQEMSVRMALGAGRFRVARQRLAESLVLATLGLAAGLIVAHWTTAALIDMVPIDRVTRELQTWPSARVMFFVAGLAALTSLIFGVAPALYATRATAGDAVRDMTRSAAGGRTARARRSLVVAQVALSVLLLSGAGLLGRSLYELRQLDPGFEAEGLLQFQIDPVLSGYDRERAASLMSRIRSELARLPGVSYVSSATVAVMSGQSDRRTVIVPGYTPREDEDTAPYQTSVGTDYFDTLGIRMLRGRDFTEADNRFSPLVAIVNETMANYYWKGEDPIGKRIGWPGNRSGGTEIEVVGLVRDSRFTSLRADIPRFVYTPQAQEPALASTLFYVRSRGSLDTLTEAIMSTVRTIDPGLPVTQLRTMEAQLDVSLFVERLLATLAAVFGALATLLAGIGLYGVTAYMVSRRTAEIGVRMALGAQPRSVWWLVLRESVLLIGVGAAIGLPLTIAASRLLGSHIVGLAALDPFTATAVVAVLGVVALLAGCLPALRATRVNPAIAFRQL